MANPRALALCLALAFCLAGVASAGQRKASATGAWGVAYLGVRSRYDDISAKTYKPAPAKVALYSITKEAGGAVPAESLSASVQQGGPKASISFATPTGGCASEGCLCDAVFGPLVANFYDQSCRSYFTCDFSTGAATKQLCPENSVFSAVLAMCRPLKGDDGVQCLPVRINTA